LGHHHFVDDMGEFIIRRSAGDCHCLFIIPFLVGHRIVTFAHSKEAHHKDMSAPFLQILRFILTSSVCVAVNWGGFQLLLNAGVGLGPALFCASAAAALLQFVGCKWFVYRR